LRRWIETVGLALLLVACGDSDRGGGGDTADATEDAIGGDPFACPPGETCPDVAAGTNAILFTRSGATGAVTTLSSGETSLFAFRGDVIELIPLMWGTPADPEGSIHVFVAAFGEDDPIGTVIHDETITYEPGPGGRFQGNPYRVQLTEDVVLVRMIATSLRASGTAYDVLDSALRIDVFDDAWRGENGAEIVIPLHVWRMRTSDDTYGADVSEAELEALFADEHVDPTLPMTINELYAPVGIRFVAEIDTLTTGSGWDYMARRVPCDLNGGICDRTRWRDFAEANGDPGSLNVYVVYFIAQDDLEPSDSDDLEDSVFGQSSQRSYTHEAFDRPTPGAWLSSKIWRSISDSRNWAPRIVAHELGHTFDLRHHQNTTTRLLMTPTVSAEPDNFVAGTGIVDLPEDQALWTILRTNAETFAEVHPVE
jgi:hypothetical protein